MSGSRQVSPPCAKRRGRPDAAENGGPRPWGAREGEAHRSLDLFSGAPAVDVVKTLEYRPAFFGTPFNAIIEEVMRGPSEWSVGERELFAAFVSERNRCKF